MQVTCLTNTVKLLLKDLLSSHSRFVDILQSNHEPFVSLKLLSCATATVLLNCRWPFKSSTVMLLVHSPYDVGIQKISSNIIICNFSHITNCTVNAVSLTSAYLKTGDVPCMECIVNGKSSMLRNCLPSAS